MAIWTNSDAPGMKERLTSGVKRLRGCAPWILIAREWVEEAHSKEKHGNRIKLLESLRIDLTDSDEPFLERCLDDRSSAVGQVAASLLRELARSAFAGRMLSRAAGILGLENGRLVCTPPSDIEADWERDGIKRKAAEGEGLRASWVEQVLAAVPPSEWPRKFSLDSRALIEAVADDPFAGAVIAGWTSAACLFGRTDGASKEWLEPLWDHHVESVGRVQSRATSGGPPRDRQIGIALLEQLLSCMPGEVAESALAKVLKPAPGWQDAEALVLLSRWPGPWSISFGKRFLATARARLEGVADESAYRWAAALHENACALPCETLALALGPWNTVAAGDASSWFAAAISREIAKFTSVIEKRQSFLRELDA